MRADEVLIVTRNLPPLRGGMERLNLHLIAAVAGHYPTTVLGPAGSGPNLSAPVTSQVRAFECAGRSLPAFLFESGLRALSLGWRRRGRTALVIATSGLTAPAGRIAAAAARCPLVTCVHGLDLVAASRLYQRLFVPAVRASARVVANSSSTAHHAADRGVARNRIDIVPPGVDIPDAGRPGSTRFRPRFGLEGRQVLLSVGRLVRRKGIVEFVERCMPTIVSRHPGVVLAIVGAEASEAARRDEGVGAAINAAVRRQSLSGHVIRCGHLDDEMLDAAYAESDVFVFPLLPVPGDLEGFGMVALEAAARGLWTVAFDEGGVRDAVAHSQSGWLVPSGDYTRLTACIERGLAQGRAAAVEAACRAHARRFAWTRYEEALVSIVRRTIEERSGEGGRR